MEKNSQGSSILSRFVKRVAGLCVSLSSQRHFFIWRQTGWVPVFGILMIMPMLIVAVIPSWIGPWVFYTVGFFALAPFLDGLIVYLVDRPRRIDRQ